MCKIIVQDYPCRFPCCVVHICHFGFAMSTNIILSQKRYCCIYLKAPPKILFTKEWTFCMSRIYLSFRSSASSMIYFGFPFHFLSPSKSCSRVMMLPSVFSFVSSVLLIGRVFTTSMVAASIGVRGLRSTRLETLLGISSLKLTDANTEKPHCWM